MGWWGQWDPWGQWDTGNSSCWPLSGQLVPFSGLERGKKPCMVWAGGEGSSAGTGSGLGRDMGRVQGALQAGHRQGTGRVQAAVQAEIRAEMQAEQSQQCRQGAGRDAGRVRGTTDCSPQTVGVLPRQLRRLQMLCSGQALSCCQSRGCVPPTPPCSASFFTSSHLMIIVCSCWEAQWGPALPGVPCSCLTHLAGPSGPCGQSGLALWEDQGWGAATPVGDTASTITVPAWSPQGCGLGQSGHSRSVWPGTHSHP